MAQKIFNLLSVLGFTVSTSLAVIGVMAYTRVPSMMKLYLSDMKLELTETILDQVPVPKMPELPKATGPAIKSPF
tara:strand:+ start:193 stop:417 length:225 start_codon:yes stop_codon:yes gene_type:complete